jgi:hypothetical protein
MKMNSETKYPIYILSKGRSKQRMTMRALDRMGVTSYRIAIEPQEYDDYARTCGEDKLLVLPFSNHGKGSGPARNWCWEHSIAEGHKRHWLMDDNIYEFWRLHKNRRYRVRRGSGIFRASEDFVDRYENIALAGLQYKFFCVDDYPYPPYILNTRIMSCFLIQNDTPIRWRGRYNEDVDISIRALQEGYCTMLFYAFLQGKARTGTVKGGNTTEVYNNYEEDASLRKSQMLMEMHPGIVTLVERYGRVHHHVDLDKIKTKDGQPARQNPLKLRSDVELLNRVDNYKMKLYRNVNDDMSELPMMENSTYDPSFSENIFPSGRREF